MPKCSAPVFSREGKFAVIHLLTRPAQGRASDWSLDSPGQPDETFFELIAQRNLTLSDVPEIAEAASAAGMDILGPPLNDEEVAAIVRGEQI
jgi:hypothetical protein